MLLHHVMGSMADQEAVRCLGLRQWRLNTSCAYAGVTCWELGHAAGLPDRLVGQHCLGVHPDRFKIARMSYKEKELEIYPGFLSRKN